jgi:hypothetical protein
MQLSSLLPQGALLTIESKDFAGVLKHWNDSPEKAAWLKSGNFGVFSRSRLFGRLGDAQSEFAKSAGLPPDMNFLNEVAGSDSIFAWYDIGKLEFLYVTRMPSGSAEKTRLFAMRGKFTRRQIGTQTFYVRTQGGQAQTQGPSTSDQGDPEGNNPASSSPDVTSPDASNPNQADASPGGPESGPARTVAFATSGDWLLLATREDLMAGALTLLARSNHTLAANGDGRDSLLPLNAEPWFADARAAAAKEPGALRMTLNLEKIVRTPYFRSYWIQRNVSEIKQYRSAVADLYLEPGSSEGNIFREERVLVPASPMEVVNATPDLSALISLLPQHAGVYRAVVAPSIESAIGSLDEKLLQRAVGSYADTRVAPNADLTVQEAGSSVDLETRIDAMPLTRPAKGTEIAALRQVLADSDLQAMMTVSRTGEWRGDAASGVFVPFQSAVVLSSSRAWDAPTMQAALVKAIAAHITAGGLGLTWKPVKTASGTYFEISETRPLEMATKGNLMILSDDAGLMQEMMAHLATSPDDGKQERHAGQASITATDRSLGGQSAKGDATLIAGFDTKEEHAAYARWTGFVNRNNASPSTDGGNDQPNFFSQDMRSLTDVFAALESERVVERRERALTRQTVIYAWRR